MHTVRRGPEPEGLANIRRKYTSHWINYYCQRTGQLPSDSYWTNYTSDLTQSFLGLCAYCEDRCAGQIDHFRPKSRNPELVYCWSNWVHACPTCNHRKGSKWPVGGYVNPCELSVQDKPENQFRFDIVTGEILPRSDLDNFRRGRAQNTIDDLRLNDLHHLRSRREWLFLISAMYNNDTSRLSGEMRSQVNYLVSRLARYSSIARAWFSEHGYFTSL